MPKIRRALLSVSDKTGIVDLGRTLAELGVEILSTGGTAGALSAAGVPVVQVSDFTGQREILGGRVKTLTPRIHGGILALRSSAGHRREMKEEGILPIDLVAVNLYPFEETISRPGTDFSEAVEQIDIGGPTMIRAAAKNFADVTVVVDPGDYGLVIDELRGGGGRVSKKINFALAKKAFGHTAYYDSVISGYLESRSSSGRPAAASGDGDFAAHRALPLLLDRELRYGENPHQRAALYRRPGPPAGVAGAAQLGGKELSFNNYLDLEAAWAVTRDFPDRPFVCIVKHNNPCGAGWGETTAQAFDRALATDPLSAFGGVIGVSRKVTAALATRITRTFFEAVIAPGFTSRALEILRRKKNLRLLRLDADEPVDLDLKRISGGFLLQDADAPRVGRVTGLPVAGRRRPTAKEYRALEFAWRLVRHVKSNAIIFANEHQLVGVGAGQMSRVDSCRIAVEKARLPIEGTVAASDAFFPFRDGIDQIAGGGATAVIQPGGSIRDEEVVQAADEHGLALVLTGVRHFRH